MSNFAEFDLSKLATTAGYIAHRAADPHFAHDRSIASDDRGADWFGFRRGANIPAEIARVARESTPESVKLVREASDAAREIALPVARSIKPVWSTNRYAGTRLNLDRALQGMPDAWGRFERARPVNGSQKIVALYVSCAARACHDKTEAAWAPVPGIVIADLLESAGYRVEIYGYVKGGYDNPFAVRTLIKASDMPVDFTSLSRVAHAAFARGIMYPALSALAPEGVIGGTYGPILTATPEDFGDDNAIVLNADASRSLHGCVAEITRVIKLFSDVQ